MPVRADRNRYRILAVSLIITAFFFMTCSQHPGLNLSRLYNKRGFSGKDLDGQSIAVMSFLTADGMEYKDILTPKAIIETVRKKRDDLTLSPIEDCAENFLRNYGVDAFDSTVAKLYKGEIVVLQSTVPFWKSIQAEYLMVLRLNYGLRSKKSNDQMDRQIRLEGELWECDSMEVVWRVSVRGRNETWLETDKEFMLRAARDVFNALPPVSPGYGKGKW